MKTKIKKLQPFPSFTRQVFKTAALAMALIIFSLGIGMLGYHYMCRLSWIDSLLNASMILTGMGPVNQFTTSEGKIFASVYAIYSGAAFLTIFAVFISPIFHRFMHKFHLDIRDEDETGPEK
jgi:hypothetical protein